MTTIARVRRTLFPAVVIGWFVVVTWARVEFMLGATVVFLLAVIVEEARGHG